MPDSALSTVVQHHDLDQLISTLRADVSDGVLPGAVLHVANGETTLAEVALGWLDPQERSRIHRDAIFRIYSLTKCITSLAALSLIGDRILGLDDAVGDWLGEFAAPVVASPDGVLWPARNRLRMRHLMTQTSGISGGFVASQHVAGHYLRQGIFKYEHRRRTPTLAEVVSRLAAVPLAAEPGTRWEYGMSMDVLGRIMEVATGRRLDEIVEERVAGPLGLRDTGFYVPWGERTRVAQPFVHAPGQPRGVITHHAPPTWCSAGSGAYSSLADIQRIAALLWRAAEGTDSAGAARDLLVDQIGELAGSGPDYIPGHGYGFSYGLHVPSRNETTARSVGWLGRAGTAFAINLTNGVTGVLLLAHYGRAVHYRNLLREAVERCEI